ncbi:MAG: hypothetical protein IJX71_02260, partial [Oscillospiraceae bacterium]|nr:hypothetical protein [Oscillospiraceae bacterium]
MRKRALWTAALLAIALSLLCVPVFAAEDTADSGVNSVEEQLYNGQKGDFEDPEFLQLLEEGFFDSSADDAIAVAASTSYTHNSRFNGYEISKGIDVSRWNVPVTGANDTPVPINWNKVKASGIDFVFIRCGYRGTGNGKLNKDIRFDLNMKGALEAGLEVGVYIYSQAITEKEAIAEANYALEMCKGYDFNLPIVIDYEYYTSGRLLNANLSKSQRTNICKAFCKTVEAANRSAMVYANKSMLVDDMYGQQIADAGYEVWLAQWISSTTYSNTYTYWQYTDAGKVSGISGYVDMNFRYKLPEANITETYCTATGVRLVWNQAKLADSYRIYRRNSGETAWTLLATITDASTVTYVDKKVTEGQSYEYTVRACSGSVFAEFDRKGTKVVFEPGFSLQSVAMRAKGVQLTWAANTAFESYEILRREGTTGNWSVIAEIEDVTQTSYVDTSVFVSGTTYS